MRSRLLFLLVLAQLLTRTGLSADWKESEGIQGKIYFHTGDEENTAELNRAIARALPDVDTKLNVRLSRPVQIYLASSQNEFDQLTGGRLPPWSQGVSFPQNGSIVLKSAAFSHDVSTLNRTAVHELVHLLLAVKAGPYVPRWLGEGLALLLSQEGVEKSRMPIARALWSGKLIRLTDVEQVDTFTADRAELAYLESQQAVEFLTQRYGWKAVSRVLDSMRQGKSWDDALFSEVGVDQAGLEAQWQESIRGAYRWMVLLDFNFFLFTGATLLVLAAGVVVMRRRKRIYRQWEAEENGN
ncbi:MAG: peptidase MA family metallohydrolase [bacterium]|nr:peptidase MA family metallohydrolase [bacterium]